MVGPAATGAGGTLTWQPAATGAGGTKLLRHQYGPCVGRHARRRDELLHLWPQRPLRTGDEDGRQCELNLAAPVLLRVCTRKQPIMELSDLCVILYGPCVGRCKVTALYARTHGRKSQVVGSSMSISSWQECAASAGGGRSPRLPFFFFFHATCFLYCYT